MLKLRSMSTCHPDRYNVSHGLCDSCRLKRDYQKRKPKIYAWRKANPYKTKAYSRLHSHERNLKKFGLTPETYTTMLVSQGGVCGICKRPPGKRRLAVDHSHATGRVRGLLCTRCNYHVIGSLEANLEKIVWYLASQ